jgi:DNA-binding transcriptional MerR regulator
MSEEAPLLTPHDVTKALDISSATLRRWADEFSDYLSPKAASGQKRSHRRYSDEDLDTLRVVKELMNSGLTYEQARQQLAQFVMAAEETTSVSSAAYTVEHSARDDEDDDQELDLAEDDDLELSENLALVAANGNESAAVAFLTNTLTTLSDTQKSILNSQAANRELLGVLIQDNFNLKEENNRLRERILEIERSHAQSRQEEEWRREALRQELDAKLMSVQQLAANAMTAAHSVEMPEIKAVKSKAGCLGALFGGGDTQIVTVPRRRGREGHESRPPGPKASAPQPPQQQQQPAHYPKPTNLPE